MSKVKKDIVVRAPLDVAYAAWRNFENFPRFMGNIQEVRVVSGGRSHWKAKGPLGMPAEWDAEVTLEEPERAIGWRSIERSGSVRTAGRVNFASDGDATRIEVTIEYDPPAGPIGEAVAKIFANPERQVEEDLRRFQEAIERGAEVSGLTYGSGTGSSGDTLGGSMGPVTERDVEEIGDTNSGPAPAEVDDPAVRNARGEDFGGSPAPRAG